MSKLVHIKVGGDVGDGREHFFPDDEQLADLKKQAQAILPEAKVIVTHHLVDIQVLELETRKRNDEQDRS